MTLSNPHFLTLLVALGVGLVMCKMALRERHLLPRRHRGRCASCSRHVNARGRCSRCG